jgi:hypothetical protein
MFRSTKFDQPCVVCGDTSGKCRSTDKTDNLVLCMNFPDKTSEIINGFKWIGYTRDHLWGKWLKVNDDKSHSPAHTPEISYKKQGGVCISPLSDQEKNYQYLKISNYLGLTNNHKQKLIDRGVPEEIINQNLFFTLNHHTKLPIGVNDDFCGVIKKGDNYFLAQKVDGFTCPVFTHNGEIIGYQVRLDDSVNGNKYFWGKGKYGSRNKNGKMPLTFISDKVYSPAHTPEISYKKQGGVCSKNHTINDLDLSEGILKPLISFLNFGGYWCGASGGNFDCDQIIDFLDHNQNIDRIILNPDAGAVKNKNVMRMYHRVITELSLRLPSHQIMIRWWGQESKDTSKDIDEIDQETFNNSQLLDAKQWVKDNFLSDQEIADHNFKNELDYQWKKLKRFTQDETVNSNYLSKDLLMINYEFYQGIAVKSGLGTGKTTALTALINHLGNGQKWISLGYRNTLNKQFCKKANFHFIHNTKVLPRDLEGKLSENLSLCIHSILKLFVDDFIGVNVILDEIESIITTSFFDINIKLPRKVLTHFKKCLQACKGIYLLDGNLSDKTVEIIEKISGKKIKKVKNMYQNKFNYKIFQGTINNKGIVEKNNHSDLISQILDNSKVCPVAVCSDSQNELETLERLLTNMGIECLRIDSKTITDPFIDKFVETFDEDVIKQYQVLLYSPSAESGLDIPIRNYFKVHYGLFFGVISHDAIIQMMGRIRDNNCPKILWIADRNNEEKLINNIQKELKERLDYILKNDELCLEDSEKINLYQKCYQGYQKDIYYQYSVKLQSMIDYENSHLRKCVEYSLKESGHDVSFVIGKDNCNISQDRQDTKGFNCSDIAVSDYLPDDFESFKCDKTSLKWKNDIDDNKPDRVSLINLSLRQRLPLIKDSEQWENKGKNTYKVGGTKKQPTTLDLTNREYLFYYTQYKSRDTIRNLENRYFYHNFDLVKKLQESKILSLVNDKTINDDIVLNLWQYQSRFSFISTLKEINLDYFLIGNNCWNNDTEEVIRVSNLIKSNKKYQNTINYKPYENSDNVTVVNTLLAKLNVTRDCKQITINKERVRVYSRGNDSDIDNLIYLSIVERLDKLDIKLNWSDLLETNETVETNTNSQWEVKVEVESESELDSSQKKLNIIEKIRTAIEKGFYRWSETENSIKAWIDDLQQYLDVEQYGFKYFGGKWQYKA